MPRKTQATKTTSKKRFEIEKTIGTLFLENKRIEQNSNGTDYIPIYMEGHNEPVAVYLNIDKIESHRVYTLVQMKPSKKGETGAYALNRPTAKETLKFWAGVKSSEPEFDGLSIAEIKEAYGVK